MLIMSSRVSTATARARSTRTDCSVWRNVASPKMTGTSRSRTADRNRFSSLSSTTATSCPAAVSSVTVRMPSALSPTTTMWLRRCRTRGRADAKTKRRDSSTSATKETNNAVVVTPLNINRVANDTQPGGLVHEAEIAVAGRGHRFDGEVERVDPTHLGWWPVSEPQHESRADQDENRGGHDRIERRVDIVEHATNGVDRSPRQRRARARPPRTGNPDALGCHLVGGADHHRPVTGVYPLIPAGADVRLAGGG